MSTVAILGAGTLGGTLAHALATRDIHQRIRLIDDTRDVAAGKTLDIAQAGPLARFRTTLVADAGPAATLGADVVLLAGPAAVPDSEWSDTAGLDLVRQIAAVNRRAVIVCVGAGHRRLVERGVTEVGIDRRRLIGSAPEALRAALRAIVALEVGCPASEVALAVVGPVPDRIVVSWSQATVGGVALETQLSAVRLARLRARASRIWPPGPYALASAAARVASTIVTGDGRRPTCSVLLDGELGTRGQAMAVPVEVDRTGVTRIGEPPLSARERGELAGARAD